jgi:hypothetical protein
MNLITVTSPPRLGPWLSHGHPIMARRRRRSPTVRVRLGLRLRRAESETVSWRSRSQCHGDSELP